MKIRSIIIAIVCIVIAYAVTHLVGKQKINKWIDENNIYVENTSLNLAMGNISFEGISLSDDRFTTDTCSIGSVDIKGFSIYDYFKNDQINVDEIKLEHAELFLHEFKRSEAADQKKNEVNISKISLDSVDVSYRTANFILDSRQVSAQVTKITNAEKLKFQDLRLGLQNIEYVPLKGSHKFTAEDIKLNTESNEFNADNFWIDARCSEEEWSNCYPNKNTRVTYKVENIEGQLDSNSTLNGINLNQLDFSNGIVKVMSFQNMERQEIQKEFFMSHFDNLDLPINIPVIKVKNHAVEVLLKKEETDTISFRQIYATFNNLTNHPELVKKDDLIKVATLSKFMDTKFRADFEFKMDDPMNAYSIKVDLDPMPFTNLNKALNYNTPLIVEKGDLQKLVCSLQGNIDESFGRCDIAYKNLYVNIEDSKGVTKSIFTKVLNLILKDGNSNENSVHGKTYTTTLQRDSSRDFFYQAYTTILQTIREAMLPI